ncbi:hypothetical protein K443DRAFT_126750, partial [Laccaria amethystina LaAM-08-1]
MSPNAPPRRFVKRNLVVSSDDDSSEVEFVEPPKTTLSTIPVGPPGKRRRQVTVPDEEGMRLPSPPHFTPTVVAPAIDLSRTITVKARVNPPTAERRSTRSGQAAASSVVVQKATSDLPKRRGSPRKSTPVVFNNPVVFDKKRFKRVIDHFGLDELPPLLKTPRPHMPEPCLQCSMRKDQAVKNCTFRGWGTPCGPCDVSHVSSCEYYLPGARRGTVRDIIRQRVAIHAPSAISSLMELISEDALHMRTLSATLESIRHRRDNNLPRAFTSSSQLILYRRNQHVGTDRAATPEGASRVDLEDLVSRFSRAEASP